MIIAQNLLTTLCCKHVQIVQSDLVFSFCFFFFTCISEVPTHVFSSDFRPKATGWAPAIPRRVLWATISVVPTSLTSAWHTAARHSLRSFSSSLRLCAPKSWTPLMRRTLCPWALSRDATEITIPWSRPANPQPRVPPSMTMKRRGRESKSAVGSSYLQYKHP